MPDAKDYCLKLTQILSAVIDTNAGRPIDSPRIASAEGLAVKFAAHCISIQYLIRGTRLPEIHADFTDPASVNVIVRAAVESVLTFYYLFVSGSSEDELNFRHDTWVLADLQNRQEFHVFSEEGKLQLAREKEQITKLDEKLRANPCLKAISDKQQKALLRDRKWRLAGWAKIGLDMGLDEYHAKMFYSYLCSHAHSGYLSVLQVQQARTAADQKMLVNGSAGVLAIALAHMIKLYVKVFPQCAAALKQIPDAEQTIQIWISIGAHIVDKEPTLEVV